MEDGRLKNRKYGMLPSFLFGIIILGIILSTTHFVITEDWDPKTQGWPIPLVRSLLISFEKTQFEINNMTDITGENIKQINITQDTTDFLILYTYSSYSRALFSSKINDVGFVRWKTGNILSFCLEPLVDGNRYVIEHGELFTLTQYGGNSTTCLFITETRQSNWLDETIVRNVLLSRCILVILIVGALSLILVPLLEFIDISSILSELSTA